MSEYNKLMDDFNNNSVAKISKTKFREYEISWRFDGFPKLISKPSFLTYVQTSFDYQFSSLLIDEIENQIDEIRHLFKTTNEGAQTYLNEVGIPEIIVKQYNMFLLTTYTTVRDFINETFINWVFLNALHEEWEIKEERYDSDKYYQYKFERLKFDFQRNLKKVLKAIQKLMPNDQTLKLMLNAYDQDMTAKEKHILDLKDKSKLN
ncbi:hypothetical protein [[Acholeplasma] multilocale]|uniref:hypothetical protein n=1 Tax=[Acholeplasma] multilocale TaxID=264638 RepID=UPI00047C556E|nr:hypothetical protein [[Acholeplasma] multilocale]